MSDTDDTLVRIKKNLRVRLPGVLSDALDLEIFNTVDEFLKATYVWREDVNFTARTTRIAYGIESEQSNAKIVALFGVKNSSDTAVAATMEEPGTIVLSDYPSKQELFTATVALTIVDPTDTDGDPQFPLWIMDRYSLELTDGILARMMSQAAKPWTSAQMASYHGRRFRNAIAQAMNDSRVKNLVGGRAWRFPTNFA